MNYILTQDGFNYLKEAKRVAAYEGDKIYGTKYRRASTTYERPKGKKTIVSSKIHNLTGRHKDAKRIKTS